MVHCYDNIVHQEIYGILMPINRRAHKNDTCRLLIILIRALLFFSSVVFARFVGARAGISHLSSVFASPVETACLSSRFSFRLYSGTAAIDNTRFRTSEISILGTSYNVDGLTNVTPRVANKVDRRLHRRPGHPLYHVRRRVENFFNSSFVNRVGNPRFAVFDDISPIVTPQQNFDSLLVPISHPSRSPSDTYYINSERLLRSHTTAHDADLIRSGLDSFLIVGDVYRRDEIDSSHYPVFHQIDGVHLFTENQVSFPILSIHLQFCNYCTLCNISFGHLSSISKK